MATDLETAVAGPDEVHDTFLPADSDGSIVLHGISWKMYRKLRRMRENYKLRMTYDRGELEIMSPSRVHEVLAALLGTLIDVWALELDVPIAGCRTMTIRRADLDRGFEPDNCYYVQHERQVREENEIDFSVDPPPDLAIAVEISHKLSKKMNIYAAFGVPELWHCRGRKLRVYELAADGRYVPRDTSICFPKLPIARIEELLQQFGTVSRTTLVRSFRDWVRDNVQPGG